MPKLLSSLIDNPNLKDTKKLYSYFIVLFVAFLVVGLFIGLLISRFDPEEIDVTETPQGNVVNEESYEGTVTFIDSFLYPQDDISFVLVDSFGEDVILLKARDQKLEVAEGHFVTVFGTEYATKDGSDVYLLVDRIIINNATN